MFLTVVFKSSHVARMFLEFMILVKEEVFHYVSCPTDLLCHDSSVELLFVFPHTFALLDSVSSDLPQSSGPSKPRTRLKGVPVAGRNLLPATPHPGETFGGLISVSAD